MCKDLHSRALIQEYTTSTVIHSYIQALKNQEYLANL